MTQITFRQLRLILRARWKAALGVFVGSVVAAVALAFLLPTAYTASAFVVVDFTSNPDTSATLAAQLSTATYIATQVDIIGSERVAELVAKRLGLDHQPEYTDDLPAGKDIYVWIAYLLSKKLEVTPSRDSNTVQISFTRPDAKEAALYANAFAQAYMDTVIDLKIDSAKRYSTWFGERSKELRADLEAKQKRLAAYEHETGIVPAPTNGKLDIEAARLDELNTELVTIQGLRQESQSRQRLNGNSDSLPEVLQSPLISGLKADLSRAEAKLQDIAANSGTNYPDYRAAAASVNELRQRIAQETAKIASSVNTTSQVNIRREAEVQAAIAEQKKRILELTHENDVVTGLQNEVIGAQRNLDVVTQRLAESSLQGETQQTNVSLLASAVPPVKKSAPKRLIILLVGFLLGILGGGVTAIARELSNRRIRVDEEMDALLNVPLLAKVPAIRPQDRMRVAEQLI